MSSFPARMMPAAPREEGERILVSFASDRRTYIRDHAWMAVIAMAGGMALLWAIGNPHAWTGAVGGLAAIVVRGAYLASDELAMRWDLTDRRLLGPGGRVVRLTHIKTVRGLGSAVQVVTKGGDKHLIKYQANRAGVEARLRAAAGL